MRTLRSSLLSRPTGPVLSVKGEVGGREVEVALDPQASASMVASEVVAGVAPVLGPETIVVFGVGRSKSKGIAMITVVIDGVARELQAQVVDTLTADVVVSMSDCARWGMRWVPDGDSPGCLFLGNQQFWWRDGLFDPLFIPTQPAEAGTRNGGELDRQHEGGATRCKIFRKKKKNLKR